MKITDISLGQLVWRQSGEYSAKQYRVTGLEDKGQDKFVTLKEIDKNSYSDKDVRIQGAITRENGWGWEADFYLFNTAEEYFEWAHKRLDKSLQNILREAKP